MGFPILLRPPTFFRTVLAEQLVKRASDVVVEIRRPAAFLLRLLFLRFGPNVHRRLLALTALRANDPARARQLLTQLADDANAPQGTRARAAEMLAALGA